VRNIYFGFAVLISFGSGYILLNVVCRVYITHMKQTFYYNISINEKHTNIKVLMMPKQDVTQNNQISTDEQSCEISKVLANNAFFHKKKTSPSFYELKVTTSITENCYT